MMAMAEGNRSRHSFKVGFFGSKRTANCTSAGSARTTLAAQFASPPRSATVAFSTPGAICFQGEREAVAKTDTESAAASAALMPATSSCAAARDGGGEDHLALAARFEVPDPGVLEEAVDDAHHADAIGNAADAGAQGADAADDEIDLHAGLRSPVERLDHVGLGERVHLGDDAALARLGGDLRLAIDELEDRCLEVERGDLELPPRHRLGVAGEQVEERGCVGAEVLLGGEERQVRVDARGARVVVARSQMHVAVQARALAADDERGFGMGLVADEPVDDVDPRLLEGARPDDVCLLVHASLEL